MEPHDDPNGWSEDLSRQFIDYGRYFVPERERQVQIMVALLADLEPSATILELCCGEGLLAEALLEAYPACSILAYDGSVEMLAAVQHRLARFEGRFECRQFDLAATSWRKMEAPPDAVVSSLAIHHLRAPQKQALFSDIFRMLAPGGALVIADVVEVVGAASRRLAAEQWDAQVRKRSLELDGNLAAFEFFQREGWNMQRGLDPDDIDQPSPLFDQLKWLEGAGFVEVEVHWAYAGHAIFGGRKSRSRLVGSE
jgi:tRNA (cmo5U34)-methyltransferase